MDDRTMAKDVSSPAISANPGAVQRGGKWSQLRVAAICNSLIRSFTKRLFHSSASGSSGVVRVVLITLMVTACLGTWMIAGADVYRQASRPMVRPYGQVAAIYRPPPVGSARPEVNSFALIEPPRVTTAPRMPSRDPFVAVAASTVESEDAPSAAKGQASKPQPGPTKNAGDLGSQMPERLAKLKVTMTVRTAECGWAVIGSRLYREGDSIEGFRLERVGDGYVRLVKGDVVCLLKMEEDLDERQNGRNNRM